MIDFDHYNRIPHKTKVIIINIKDTQGSFENYDGKFTDNVVCLH